MRILLKNQIELSEGFSKYFIFKFGFFALQCSSLVQIGSIWLGRLQMTFEVLILFYGEFTQKLVADATRDFQDPRVMPPRMSKTFFDTLHLWAAVIRSGCVELSLAFFTVYNSKKTDTQNHSRKLILYR